MATINGFHRVGWFIGGGAEHSPELLRIAARAFSGGGQGVVEPQDLRVSAMDVPTNQVRIAPGAAILRNVRAGVGSESYVVAAYDWSYLDIPTNGSGTRTDLIGVRVDDPQYEGVPDPPDPVPADWEFVKPHLMTNVTADQLARVKRGESITEFPVYWLNYLVMDPNTSTVQDSALKPLRKLAQAGFLADAVMAKPTPEDALIGPDADLGRVWPDFAPMIHVPHWATRCTITANLSSVGLRDGATQALMALTLGNTGGAGGLRSADIGIDLDAPQVGGSREFLQVQGRWDDVRSLAGQDVRIQLEGRKILHTENPGYLVTVEGTQVSFTYMFHQEILD